MDQDSDNDQVVNDAFAEDDGEDGNGDDGEVGDDGKDGDGQDKNIILYFHIWPSTPIFDHIS